MTILIVVTLQVCLVNDPRNPYNILLTVEYLSNVVNGRLVLYNNQPVEVLKKLAAASLKDNEVIKLLSINLFSQVNDPEDKMWVWLLVGQTWICWKGEA